VLDDEVGPVEGPGIAEGVEGGGLELDIRLAERRFDVGQAVLGRELGQVGEGVGDAHRVRF
jgi:hypothetical protein